MTVSEGPTVLSWTRGILGRRWKIVANNAFVDIHGIAPMQVPDSLRTYDGTKDEKNSDLENSDLENSDLENSDLENGDLENGDLESKRKRAFSLPSMNLFDHVVALSGRPVVLVILIVLLLIWMILGIVLGPSQTWMIVVNNASSIQCYVSDTLLMRQQRNHINDQLGLVCYLRSRNATCRRIVANLRQVDPSYFHSNMQTSGVDTDQKSPNIRSIQEMGDVVHLPPRSLYDRICDPIVWILGSLYFWIIYWIGIFVWVGFGKGLQWDNNWQLYINTATAVELSFVMVFLQNIRHRHRVYLEECFESITDEDVQLESRLRAISHDLEPNPRVEFEYNYMKETTRGQRIIDYYAAILGTSVGLVLSVVVFIVWFGIGSPMQWNSNWWLIIGTYTGLAGFLDGFILRNVYFRGTSLVDRELEVLAEEDARLEDLLGMSSPPQHLMKIDSLQDRIAKKVSEWFSRSGAALGGFLVVVTVLVISTAMLWSETGQLISNTPTMIIEGYMMLVLIQAHSVANTSLRLQVHNTLIRRVAMNSQVSSLISRGGVNSSSPQEKCVATSSEKRVTSITESSGV